MNRPSKPTLVQFHVTNEDIVRNTTIKGSVPRPDSRRGTWPSSRGLKKPGGYSFDAPPTLVATPWELDRSQRSRPSQTYERRGPKTCRFHDLPRQVVYCILEHLESLHWYGSTVHVRSFYNDLRAVCVLNKHWQRLARERLYCEIWVPRHQEQRSSLALRKQRSRLQLLLRTLKESPYTAGMVTHLRITAELADDLELESLPDRQAPRDSSTRMLQELISLCRNLEHMSGYAPLTLESNKSLLETLASCRTLKSHAWRLPVADFRSYSIDISRFHTSLAFNSLETLLISQPLNGNGTGIGTISAVIQRLPSLKHLALQGISPTDFHNGTLLSLPALRSLRLEEVHGVTDQGIDQLAYARLVTTLERLALIGLELTSFQTLQMLFANLTQLRSLALVQKTSPEISQVLSVTASHTNYSIASATINYLHWDVQTPGGSIVNLANSIAAGKFPQLRKVKIPCDDDGVIQGLCRPIALQEVTDDDKMAIRQWARSSNYERSLRVSQIQAQLRVRRERKQPALTVVIQDDEEATKETHVIGSYLGNVASNIEYSLDEAVLGTGSAITQVEDVLMTRSVERRVKVRRGEEYMLDLNDLF